MNTTTTTDPIEFLQEFADDLRDDLLAIHRSLAPTARRSLTGPEQTALRTLLLTGNLMVRHGYTNPDNKVEFFAAADQLRETHPELSKAAVGVVLAPAMEELLP